MRERSETRRGFDRAREPDAPDEIAARHIRHVCAGCYFERAIEKGKPVARRGRKATGLSDERQPDRRKEDCQ